MTRSANLTAVEWGPDLMMSIGGAIVLLVSTAGSLDDLGRSRPPQPGAYPQQAAGDDADGKYRNKDPKSGGHTAIVRLCRAVRSR